jgi:hypothetical protein
MKALRPLGPLAFTLLGVAATASWAWRTPIPLGATLAVGGLAAHSLVIGLELRQAMRRIRSRAPRPPCVPRVRMRSVADSGALGARR